MKTVVEFIDKLLQPDLQPSPIKNREIKKMRVVLHDKVTLKEYVANSAYLHDGTMYVEISELRVEDGIDKVIEQPYIPLDQLIAQTEIIEVKEAYPEV